MRAPFADAGADHAPAGPARPDSRTGEGTVNLAGLLRLRGFARVNRKIEVKSKALAKPRARRPEIQLEDFWFGSFASILRHL